jgi:membrane protein YdbS with pleckstrin-like domain
VGGVPQPGASIHHSKVDLWLIVVIALSLATSTGAVLAVFLKGGVPAAVLASTALLVLVAGIGLPLWVLLGTRYELTPERLLIRCGPFRWTVPVREIRAVTPTRNPLSSPALSLDRLRIDYGRGSSVMISPRDKARFLADLEQRRSTASSPG